MKRILFDAETNNLIDSFKTGTYATVSKLWCIATINIDTQEKRSFNIRDNNLQEGLEYLKSADVLLGHNIVDFDLRVFKLLYHWTYTGKVIDTLTMSKLLYPERAGGHGLEAWGKKLNRYKPEHEDWTKFSDEMMHRCEEDTEINLGVYRILCSEAREPIEGVRLW